MVDPSQNVWQPIAERPPLGPDDVHVWLASLDRSESGLAELRAVLSEDERRRADRFYFEEDRKHFAAGRGLLRTILATYLSRPPEELRFGLTSYGKPFLSGGESLCFNLSHSHGHALFAVTQGRELGVDLERIDHGRSYLELAEHYFSECEKRALRALPAAMQADGFFVCWARKEAYIKARGKGLAIDLSSFDVSLTPGEPAALLACREGPVETGRWTMRALPAIPGYAAALLVEGQSWRLWCGQWPDDAGCQR
jgi:4'-phosphopantetheinyl transferase